MDSKNWMSRNKGDTGTMYLKHVKEVLGFIATRYRGLRALMWDDMLRRISAGALRGERTGTAAVAPKLGVSAVSVLVAALAGIVPGGSPRWVLWGDGSWGRMRSPRHPPAAGTGAHIPIPALPQSPA